IEVEPRIESSSRVRGADRGGIDFLTNDLCPYIDRPINKSLENGRRDQELVQRAPVCSQPPARLHERIARTGHCLVHNAALMSLDEMLCSERIACDQRLRHTQADALSNGQLIRLNCGALRRQRIDGDCVQAERQRQSVEQILPFLTREATMLSIDYACWNSRRAGASRPDCTDIGKPGSRTILFRLDQDLR